MNGRSYRVLFVSLFPPRVGGLPLQSAILARNLEREGVEVVRAGAHYSADGRRPWQRMNKAIRQVAGVVRECRRHVHTADWVLAAGCSWWGFMPVVVAILLANRSKKPVSVLYHGGAAPRFLQAHHGWVRPLLRRAHMVAVTSSWLQDTFAQYDIPTTVVPPIVDLTSFPSRATKGGGLTFLSTRYLEPIYDVATILEGFCRVQAAYPQARLIVAGSGSQQPILADFAERHRLNVTFTGHLDRDRMAELLRRADFYLNAARVDNMPLSVLEAMWAGAVVVTTPVGELPYLMVHGAHGLFFEPGDADSLAKTVLYAVQHEEVCERCRRRARHLAKSFTWDRVRHRYLLLIDPSGKNLWAASRGHVDAVMV